MLVVTYSQAHHEAREIGTYDTVPEAVEAAIGAGAVEAEARAITSIAKDVCLNVAGHEGDDDFGIWIERART